MKQRLLVLVLAIGAVHLFCSYTFPPDEGSKDALVVRYMLRGMQLYHYQPQALNDQFSEMVFDEYLERMDVSKRIFTAKDLDELKKYRTKIDDELNQGNFDFFEQSLKIYQKRLAEVKIYSQEILAQPVNLRDNGFYEADPDKIAYAKSTSELRDRWVETLEYAVLTRLSAAMDRQSKEADPALRKPVETLEQEAREKVLKNYEDYFKRMERRTSEDYQAVYFNAITALYDPHTNYFPPADKENFDISMSGKLEGIGAQLSEDDGYIKIVNIVPGSASARQGDLKVNDLIIKVAQGENEPVDVVGMEVDEAVKLIRGPKGTEVRLTVRKVDGTEQVVPIVRDIVELEETYAKSAILSQGADGQKIGYIYLPKFYADFNDRNGRRCATDVEREIAKLKTQGVSGIILDLRDNGGGSLQDVVDMTGLFIDKGPVVQVKSREGMPQILADRNPQVQYDGNLIVMVNALSASASEIMAAAIQDYGRGLIVGMPTFGKGTVQRFVNLDEFERGYSAAKPLGEVKLTIQKFYRINGGSTQVKGVTPDILIPDEYSSIGIGEREEAHYMPWDEISPVPYAKWSRNPGSKLAELQAASQTRVSASPTFELIGQNAERLKRRQDESRYPLNLEAYEAYRKEVETEAEKFKNIETTIEAFTVAGVPQDLEGTVDPLRREQLDTWYGRLRKDAALYETLQIMMDLNK
ncbi:MAG: carboxy terminal-processing peptidase [Bacteroidia bacterium]|nr:carboxy terminal-processing peptidase [Bacteroidia bacterium]